MADCDVRPDIAERVLGHVIPGVAGTYNRSKHADQKADALQVLANRIAMIISPPAPNVIAIRRKGKTR
jgi:hypothetical protein